MGIRLISAYCDRPSLAVCSRPEWGCICNHLPSIFIIIIMVSFIFFCNTNTSFNFSFNLGVGGSFNHECTVP